MKIFGREKVIQRIWHTLEEKSILLTAERRMGKTEVLKQMASKHPDNYIVIASDLEKISTPIEFINDVLKSVTGLLSNQQKAKNLLDSLRDAFGGTELGDIIKLPETQNKNWKALLSQIIADVCQNNPEKTILFLWDEVPYMLQKIESSGHANVPCYSGLEVLDTLRALRMEQPNLRMIFTGSIGLHHVVKALKKDTLSSQPTNDMDKVNLLPLTLEHAHQMARYRIVEKEKLLMQPDTTLLSCISESCDYIPFYIEKLIKHCASQDIDLTAENVNATINTILVGGEDSWELAHFRSRLKVYYQGSISNVQETLIENHVLAKALLNHIAIAATPQNLSQCFKALTQQFALDTTHRDNINELLTLLVKDHYLTNIPNQGYQFTFTIVQRWWIEAEGLAEGDA